LFELAHMTEAQERAYVLADNQLALNAGWDEELLRLELADLSNPGFDLGLIGLRGRAGAAARGRQRSLNDDDDAPALPEQTVTTPGDLWVLGEHRVLCGDATVIADVERVLGGQLADMTFCDPPYNVDYANWPKDKLRGKHRPILNDNLGGGFEAFLDDACVNVLSVTKGAVYVCMSSSELHTLHHLGEEHVHPRPGRLPAPLRADPRRLEGWERPLLVLRPRPGPCVVRGQARQETPASKNEAGGLVERAVRNSSKSRDIVLDPFAGSGSTLIACEKSGRQARLVELDPKYSDVIVWRWQEWTGETAVLDSDGRSFTEIASVH
jgi:16S rRNA G966 N2-methylase RsmD